MSCNKGTLTIMTGSRAIERLRGRGRVFSYRNGENYSRLYRTGVSKSPRSLYTKLGEVLERTGNLR